MKTFRIENRASGLVLGEYEGDTQAEALDAMARDAGHTNFAAACEVTEEDGSDLIVTEVAVLAEGDEVEAGKPGTEDYDTGTVLEIDGDRAFIGWQSGVQTWAQIADLRAL